MTVPAQLWWCGVVHVCLHNLTSEVSKTGDVDFVF